ncbi:MAG: hypothetical protein IPL26_28540 [Leptospiraceae bacterium]|nr:hypothetical protein [Leptospiraceae bacterium]
MHKILYLFLFLSLSFVMKAEEEKPIWMSIRMTSDHNFRGYNYGALASQRNNTSYTNYTFAPALQPQFIYSTPLKGLKTLFWGNFFLNNLKDKDNDLFALQDGPGESDRTSAIISEMQSGTGVYDPSKTRSYRERNSLGRYDGIFFGIYYDWKTAIGDWSVGTWMWNNLNRFGKYSWQEWFIWYTPPFAKWANPKLSFFLNTSFDNGGSSSTPLANTNGQNYIQLDFSHTFFSQRLIHVIPKLQAGYVQNNDNTNKRSGISNAIASLQFVLGNMDLTMQVLYRPEAKLYDTYDQNRSDGKLPDPARQYGNNRAVYDELARRYPKDVASAIFNEWTSEKFVRTIFIFSMGYTIEF